MNTVGERLKELRNKLGLQQDDIAAWLEASRQSVSNWEKNKNNLSSEQIIKIIEQTQVNAHWLLTGQGEMLNNNKTFIETTTNNNLQGNNNINGSANVHSEKNSGVIQAPVTVNGLTNEIEILKQKVELMSQQLEDAKSQIKEKDAQIREKDSQINKLLDKISK